MVSILVVVHGLGLLGGGFRPVVPILVVVHGLGRDTRVPTQRTHKLLTVRVDPHDVVLKGERRNISQSSLKMYSLK